MFDFLLNVLLKFCFCCDSLLASAIALADAGASSGNPSSSAALEGLGKMQKLLGNLELLDDYFIYWLISHLQF